VQALEDCSAVAAAAVLGIVKSNKIKVYWSCAPNTTAVDLTVKCLLTGNQMATQTICIVGPQPLFALLFRTNSTKKVLGEQWVSKEVKTTVKRVKNSSEAKYRHRLIEVVCTCRYG
jgi:prophage antirepressor-like protein